MTAQARFRFVHLTDTHVMAGGGWRFGSGDAEFDTAGSLRRVVQAVRGLDPAPDFAVLGGDLASPDLLDRTVVLTSMEYEPSYRLLSEILAELPCPLDGLTMLTTPSTCLQLSKVSQARKALPGPPGFRIVDVAGDRLSTRVVYLHGPDPLEI